MKNKILVGVIVVSLIGIILLGINLFKGNIKETSEDCFEFNKETKTITAYLDVCETEVSIPDKIKGVEVEKIASYAFRDKGIEKLVLPETLKEVGIGAFYGNKINSLKLNEGLEQIKAYAFFQNKIEKIEIPTSVKTIGISAFNNNELKDKYAFIYQRNEDGTENKSMLIGYGGKNKEVEIPEGVEMIYLSALSENGIKSITFSSTVERIEFNALSDNEIEEITIPKNIMHLGENALMNNPIEKITIEGKKSIEEFNYVGNNWNNDCKNIIFK